MVDLKKNPKRIIHEMKSKCIKIKKKSTNGLTVDLTEIKKILTNSKSNLRRLLTIQKSEKEIQNMKKEVKEQKAQNKHLFLTR